ncbi:MAG TPA: WYL domain-containing protein, partial [Marmoricola sp.]|nr:WYL domain-containing protein [Marmoricola sp.]
QVPITFDYQVPGQEIEQRKLQPWRMFSVSGRWYVVGFDVVRQEPRAFRLSRFRGEVKPSGRPGSYELPEEDELKQAAAKLAPKECDTPAVVLVLEGSGNGLRRRATEIEKSYLENEFGTWDRLIIPFDSEEALVGEILRCGEQAFLEAPLSARNRVVSMMERILERGAPA